MATKEAKARESDPNREGEPRPRERDRTPDEGREDQGPAREDKPGRPSPHTDQPEGPGRSGSGDPLVRAWDRPEDARDPPSQRPRDTHEEEKARKRKAG